MWTFCWCFIFLFVTSSLGSVYSVYLLRGTWCNNDHLDYSPKGFFWCLRNCPCDFCMANDFLAQRHLLSQICVFRAHRRLKDILSNVQNNTVSSLPFSNSSSAADSRIFFDNNNFVSLLYWKSWKRGRELAVRTHCFVHSTTNLCDQINYNDHSVDMKKNFLKRIWWCRKTWTWAGITTPKPKAAQCWKHIREIHHRHVTFVCGRTAEMKCRFNVGCSFLTYESTWCTRMNDYSSTSIKSQLTMCTISRANIIWNFTSAR